MFHAASRSPYLRALCNWNIYSVPLKQSCYMVRIIWRNRNTSKVANARSASVHLGFDITKRIIRRIASSSSARKKYVF